MKKTMKKSTKGFLNNLITYAIVIIAFVFTQMALSKMIPGVTISRSLKGQLIPICVYIVMAVSLNLTVGISGELSLGHAGFMSVGAFSGIIMSGWLLNAFQMENETMRLVLAMLAGGVCAAIAGVLIGIPVLRLRGDYLAIVTLAFGEIIRNVMNCLYFAVSDGKLIVNFNNPRIDGTLLYNGPAGAVRVGRIATFEAGFVLVLLTLFVGCSFVTIERCASFYQRMLREQRPFKFFKVPVSYMKDFAREAKEHGLLEVMPALCNPDFEGMELLHARLVRTTTCANGCKCDYAICGDRDPYLKEHPEYRDAQGYRRNR